MIINLRGTNATGKSYVVRQLMQRANPKSIYGLLGCRAPEAYRLDGLGLAEPVFVLGPYQTNIGGCDRIQPYEFIIELLNQYAPHGHIIFEGSLISDNFGKIGEWLEKRGRESAVVFLDTPLPDCFRQLRARTPGAGEKHVTARFNAIRKVRDRFLREGQVSVLDTSSENGADAILRLLKNSPQEVGCLF